MRNALREGIPLLLLTLALASCGDDPTGTSDPDDDGNDDPQPGALQVIVETEGNATDPDGYSIRFEGGDAQSVATNATVDFANLEPGQYSVEFSGNDGRCYLEQNRELVAQVRAGQTTTMTFSVVCYRRPLAFESDVPTRPVGGYTKVTVVDDDGSFPRQFGLGSVSGAPHFSPDGLLAYVFGDETTGLGDLRLTLAEPLGSLVDATGRGVEPLGWSGDGSRFLALSGGAYNIYEVESGSFTQIPLGFDVGSSLAAIAPDGMTLALNPLPFLGNGEVWISDFDRATPVRIGNPDRDYQCRVWSADATELYCQVWVRDQAWTEVVALDVATGAERPLIELATLETLGSNGYASPATLTPDGSRVVVTIQPYDPDTGDGRSSIYSVAPDGSDLRDLSQAPNLVYDRIHDWSTVPLWSSETGELAFIRCDNSGGVNCPTTLRAISPEGAMRTIYDIPAAGSGNHAQWIPAG